MFTKNFKQLLVFGLGHYAVAIDNFIEESSGFFSYTKDIVKFSLSNNFTKILHHSDHVGILTPEDVLLLFVMGVEFEPDGKIIADSMFNEILLDAGEDSDGEVFVTALENPINPQKYIFPSDRAMALLWALYTYDFDQYPQDAKETERQRNERNECIREIRRGEFDKYFGSLHIESITDFESGEQFKCIKIDFN
jgi:hypothetical protein